MYGTISEIHHDENGIRPVIVQFENSELREGEEKKLQAGIYRKSKNTNVVAVATSDLLYTGTIKRKKDKHDLYNRFLLVSNKKTGKVRLISVDTAILRAKFPEKESKNVVENIGSVEWTASTNKLNKQFGSKRVKRLTEQRERLRMNVEDVKDQLEQTVAAVEINESSLFTGNDAENDSLYRPVIHREATVKEQVYVIDELVPKNVLNSLEEEAQKLNPSELSPLLKQYAQQSSVSDDLDKCQLLLYIHYLIQYVNMPAKNITTKKVIWCKSSDVVKHILDNFSVASNTGRTRPLAMKDKTVCYILVLAMIAFDYQLDCEALAKDLKIGIKKLTEMARILAFSAHGKEKNTMVLKIPLPPAVSISPRKRKKM